MMLASDAPQIESDWDAWLSSHSWMLRAMRHDLTHQTYRWQPPGEWSYPTPGKPGFHGLAPRPDQQPLKVQFQMAAWPLPALCETRGSRWHFRHGRFGVCEVDAARILATGPDVPLGAYCRLGWQVASGSDVTVEQRGMWIIRSGDVRVRLGSPTTWRADAVFVIEGGRVQAEGIERVRWHLRGGELRVTGQITGHIAMSGGACWMRDCVDVGASISCGGLHMQNCKDCLTIVSNSRGDGSCGEGMIDAFDIEMR